MVSRVLDSVTVHQLDCGVCVPQCVFEMTRISPAGLNHFSKQEPSCFSTLTNQPPTCLSKTIVKEQKARKHRSKMPS